jgi:hypothetical protein
MNLYSRALRYISISDVKQKHQQKLVEQWIKEEEEKQEKQYKESLMKGKRYNWRKELNEQMTTTDMFFSTLPAEGNVDLIYPDLISGGGNNATVSGGTVTIGGDPSPFLSNGILLNFDSSVYDTIKFNVNMFVGSVLGIFVGNVGSPTKVIFSSGTYTLSVAQSKDLQILFDTPDQSTITLSGFAFQRRTPLNVFVSLDSPEATSFIRSGTGSSAEKRQKYVEEILTSGKEYTNRLFGSDFPGSNVVMPGSPRMEPGVEVSDFDISKMEKNYGEVAGSMNTPSSATKFMQDLMKDGFGGNEVRTTVNGQRMTGRPAEIIQQIKLNFPGGV